MPFVCMSNPATLEVEAPCIQKEGGQQAGGYTVHLVALRRRRAPEEWVSDVM